MITRPLCVCLTIGSFAALAAASVAAAPPSPPQLEFFEAQVRPLLVERCYDCHSEESGESGGGLFLDSAAGIQRGGAHGPAIQVDDPDGSLIWKAISYQDPELKMPPDEQLDEAALGVMQRWLEMGAPDPRQGSTQAVTSPLERDPSTHWAFVVPTRADYPLPAHPGAADPIDALADEAAATTGLQPNPIAPPATLIRRLYFDLTGLPPTAGEIEEFVSSARPDAYTRLVDALLASPEFGERFARHWMDVSRYANTLGYITGGRSREYEGSERFRDWAIHAFASDMPYDEMILHQLAADRTDPENEQGNLDAMGFLTLGRTFLNQYDTLDDRIDVITRGLLAMTVTCARCHDHKFDPISTADYYAIGGIINSSEKPAQANSPLMLADKANPADHPILIRGQAGNHGPIARRQFLTALRKPNEPPFSDGSGRWELAQRIAAADNPLTARVMVNRIWEHLIGRPLVDTPSDFGFRTPPPDVPAILDDLAVEFSEHWSVKRIVRRIVRSRIYCQSATTTDESIAQDPENRLLARANRRRRDFESLRDSMLSVSGLLDRSLGGTPVTITADEPHPRRTIYARIERQNLPPVFRTFDFASPDTHSPLRYYTTVPQQALFLMNNRQTMSLARATADRIRRQAAAADLPQLATMAFRLVLGRDPDTSESATVSEFLAQRAEPVFDPRRSWSYGVSKTDDQQRPIAFEPLNHFQQDRWQAEEKFPAPPPFGHATLGGSGGHTPNDTTLATVRRWSAPCDGTIAHLGGKINHGSDLGDGIHVAVWIGATRHVARDVHHTEFAFDLESIRVEAGQTVDLVALPGQSDSHDTFAWTTTLTLRTDDGSALEFDSQQDFSGPIAEPIQATDRLTQLVHTLMMTNEFAFID